MALVLSERGVGKVQEILRSPTDLVLDAWHFAQFRADWVETEAMMNQKETAK